MTTATISPWPLVRKGDQQHPVKTLQYLLRARGHTLTVDGIFGPNTDAAVRAFQQQKGLAVDGIVGPNTWSALIITVKQGNQGDAVRGVQEEFQFRNLSGDPSKGLQVNGIFGPKTDAAVRGFQQALHQDIPSVTVERHRRARHLAGPDQRNALVLIWEPDRSCEMQVTDRCLAGFDRATRCLKDVVQLSRGLSPGQAA